MPDPPRKFRTSMPASASVENKPARDLRPHLHPGIAESGAPVLPSRPMGRRTRFAFLVFWLSGIGCPTGFADYGYPIQDAYLATVVGTARSDQARVPTSVPERVRRVARFPGRQVPKVFFNPSEFTYTFSGQKHEAPLIFVIAGTGASHRSQKMRFLQRAFFGAGFHVASISSPTSPDFVLTGSESRMPGWMKADVRDLYELMKLIRADLDREVEVSRVYLTGYSLGGSEAAFLGSIDQREQALGFERILMINPSVSLFTSVNLLDGLFRIGIPDGPGSAERLVSSLLGEIASYTREKKGAVLDSELLYKIAARNIAAGRPPKRENLQALIAAAFRLTSGNLVFTADVVHGGGHVVAANRRLGVTSSLTVPFKRSMRWPFERYLDEMLVPYWSGNQAEIDRDSVVQAADLASIRGFLSKAEHVGVITNADDIILTPANLDFLRETFGARATIYPVGGHCGNLQYHENVRAMLAFFGAQP